ncbi:MAG: hypothetical protein KGL39_14725 [Patescibacteria group bacterium]|nr:hypothetical protein [Patescibacteria group bacterium]
MALLSDLRDAYARRPIIVIGGGPSVANDLHKIPKSYPACVISANEHGFRQDRFDVNYIVSVDYTYSMSRTPMREKLAQYGRPSINRWSWADYRIPEWHFNGDSGLSAIAVAVMLGGWPVIALGMDRWVGPKRYFWQEAPSGWDRRRQPNSDSIRVNTQRCVEFCAGFPVRTLSGVMQTYWPKWEGPDADYGPWVAHAAPQRTLTGKPYSILARIFLHPADPVDHGPLILTAREAQPFLRVGKIRPA